MSAVDVVLVALIVIIAGAAVSRSRVLRKRPDDLAVRALLLAMVNVDIALALGLPAIYWAVYRILGEVPGLPQLFAHAAGMAMAFHLQVFTLCVASPDRTAPELRRDRRAKRRWLLVGLAILVMCYLIGPLRTGLPFIPVGGASNVAVAAYVAVLQVYIGVAGLDVMLMCWRNRRLGPAYLGVGLRLIAAGAAFGVLFSLHKLVYFAAVASGVRVPWDESGSRGIQLVFLAPSLLLGLAGFGVPHWWPRFAWWWERRRTHRRLIPLVSALRAEAVDGALVELPRLRGLDARLLGQVITVRDILLGPLRQYLDLRVYQLAYERAVQEGLGSDDSRAIAEAACIRGAISKRSCRSPQLPLAPHTLSYEAELESEALWLAQVSDAFSRSALVAAVLDEHSANCD